MERLSRKEPMGTKTKKVAAQHGRVVAKTARVTTRAMLGPPVDLISGLSTEPVKIPDMPPPLARGSWRPWRNLAAFAGAVALTAWFIEKIRDD